MAVSRMLFSILIGVFLAQFAFAGVNSWSTQGPPGGTFKYAAGDPYDSKTIYAAYSRSLHKSSDGGDTWRTILDSKNEFTGLVVDQDGKVYIAIWTEGVFRSDNGGASFVQIATGTSSGPYGVGVAGATVYYSSGGLFRRSSDRGATWITRTAPPQTLTTILVDTNNSDSIFAFSGSNFLRSNDGGGSWTQGSVFGNSATIVNAALLMNSTSLIVCGGNAFYYSSDAGVTWSQGASVAGCISLAADPNVAGAAIAGSSIIGRSGFLYRTVDYGATWTAMSTSPTGPAQGVVIGRGTPAPIAIVNSTNAWRTSNLGVSWSIASQAPIASTSTLALALGSNSTIYAYSNPPSTGTSALYATSGTEGWRQLDLSMAESAGPIAGILSQAVLSTKPRDPNSIYFGTPYSGLLRSTNAGISWSRTGPELSSFGIEALAFDPNNPATMYAKTSQNFPSAVAAIYRSDNSGTSWSSVGTALPTNATATEFVVDPFNSQHLLLGILQVFAPNGVGGLYQSIDGGVNWSQQFAGENVRSIATDPIRSNIIYVGTTSGLQKSVNGGLSFAPLGGNSAINNQPVGSVVFDPTAPTTLYVATYSPSTTPFSPQRFSYVLRSVDEGATWETLRLETDMPNWAINKLLVDPHSPTTLYASTDYHGVASFEVAPDLALSVNGHSGARLIGAESSFNVRTQNDGSLTATEVSMIITLPNGLSGVSVVGDKGPCNRAGTTVTCTVAALKAGQSANASVAYTPSTAMSLPVSASVSAHENDSITANNVASAIATAGQVVDLSATLSASSSTVTNGDTFSYLLTIANNGPIAATDALATLTTDSSLGWGTMPSGCSASGANTVCNTGALAVGASRSFIVPATANRSGPIGTTLSVTTIADAADSTTTNNTSTATVNALPAGDISVEITESADPVAVSTPFVYSVAVRNAGPDAMPNATAIISASSAMISFGTTRGSCISGAGNVACNFGTLESGGIVTLTITTASSSAGSISLTASATSDGTDRVGTNNSDQEFTTVNSPSVKSGGGGSLTSLWISLLLSLYCLRPPHFRRR